MAVTALGGSPATGGPLRAPIERFADLAALEALEAGALQGKIAFISQRMQRNREGSGYGETVAGRSRGPYVAAQKGALALIIRSVGTDNERLAHTGMMSNSEPGVAVPSAAVSNPDADLLDRLLQRGQRVEVELDLDCGFDGEASSYNVIGEFDGREPDGTFVVVGGHLDSWDLGTGAIDDGTGVAITMAAAHLVYAGDTRPSRSTRVVLFANEEQGVYGGEAYAERHAGELAAHLLGAESDLGSGRIYRMTARVMPEALSAVAELESLLSPLGIPWDREVQAGGGADIGQMRKIGMPVIDLSHDATWYFDLHHTPNDTLDKVDPADLAFNVAAYVSLIQWAADSTVVYGPVPASE